jgi:hypothetical protein
VSGRHGRWVAVIEGLSPHRRSPGGVGRSTGGDGARRPVAGQGELVV